MLQTPKKDLLQTLSLIPIFLSLILTVSLVILNQFLPSRLPLFYSLSWGENQLANTWQFLIIPASCVVINLINLIIYWQLNSSWLLFKRILIISSLIASVLLLVSYIKIILLFL